MKKLLAILALCFSVNCLAQVQSNFLGGTAIASAAYTAATVNSIDIANTRWAGGHIVINTTAFTSGVYTPHVQGKDPVSGTYYDILVGTGANTVTATGAIVLKVMPGVGAVAGGAANDIIPPTWRVQMIGTGGPSATFSVSYVLLY